MGGTLRVTVLGCGSSGGVPRIGANGPNWGACDPENPLNRRRRCALLVQRLTADARTSLLIDPGPDISQQLVAAGVGDLDAVLISHDHADHCHGIDDLRMVAFNRRARVPTWMDARTEASLMQRFGYAFETPPGSNYPPILERHRIEGPVTVDGPGGAIRAEPCWVPHGEIDAIAFRIGPVFYAPDISEMTEAAWAMAEGIDCWILDALRHRPHVSHVNVETALAWIARARPGRAYLTNMHVDLDYAALEAETPETVSPAHDGLTLDFAL